MQPSQELIDKRKKELGFSACVYAGGTIGYEYELRKNPLNLSSKEIEYFYTNGISRHEAERILILEIKQGIK